MRTLHLTSPYMRGDDVKAAQGRLNGNNFLKADYLQGAVDGVFGEETARACKRAKFWLGYAESDIQGTYGDTLRDYLSGETPLSAGMKKRRKARQEAAESTPLRVLAFNALVKHVGETESPPGSNHFPWATNWYGVRGPWCAMAVSHAYVTAGSKSFRAGYHYSYCPAIRTDARFGNNHLSLTKTPQKGDLVLFDWDNDNVADHVGLFDEWITKGVNFKTCEGNTSADSSGSQSNGGGVYRRERHISDVVGFVHVGSGS